MRIQFRLSKLLNIRSLVFAVLALSFVSLQWRCNRVQPAASQNTAGTAKLCIAGGATLDAQANICVCSQGSEWSGQKCEPVQAQSAALKENGHSIEETSAQDTTVNEPAPATVATEEIQAKSDTQAKPDDKAWVEEFKRRCVRAKGSFLEKEQFCLCPDTKVLVGNTCHTLQGHLIDDVCLRAVRPGKWIDGNCLCAKNLTFSASRGGCVKPLRYNKNTVKFGKPNMTKALALIQKRNCENSINKGLWDPKTLDCTCQNNKVFFQELCVDRHRISSRDLCESFSQGGTWSRDLKTCQCPVGRVWVNQKCTAFADVTPQDGCHSNGSGGVWEVNQGACLCPSGKVWAISGKTCRFPSDGGPL
jgi:hypothetical protein